MIRNKKDRERQFIDEIAKLCSTFPQCEITDFESPDFLIYQDSQIIGIEVVNYVRGQNQKGSPERRNEISWQKIADAARRNFEANHNDPLLIHFLWNHNHPLCQAEIIKFSQEVPNIIETHIPRRVFENIRINQDELEGTLLEGICHSISVMRVRNPQQTLWSFVDSGFIEIKTNELQNLIDLKNDKIQKYLKHCKTVWLIIVADGQYISSNIDLSISTKNNIYSSMFEKIFVYDRINHYVYNLQTKRV